MTVPMQDIFSEIPISCLFAVLIVFSLNLRISDLLYVKTGNFDNNLSDRKNFLNQIGNLNMGICLVPN